MNDSETKELSKKDYEVLEDLIEKIDPENKVFDETKALIKEVLDEKSNRDLNEE